MSKFPPESKKVLIVDDEKDIARGIEYNLQLEGYSTKICFSGEEAINELRQTPYSLVLLDIMMPKTNGLKVLDLARKEGILTPIILLTAKSQIEDKVFGLDLGADDYITKPFQINELLARMNAVLRRGSNQGSSANQAIYTFEDMEIDFKSYSIRNNRGSFQLSNFETQILKHLLSHKNQVVTREELLKDVWGYTTLPNTRTIDNHIARLRKKVENNPENPTYIITIHGIGYKFVTDKEKK